MVFLARLIPNSVYPQVNTDIFIVFQRGFINLFVSREYGFLKEIARLPIVYFGVFGATLVLFFQKINNFKTNEFINIISLCIVGYLLVMLIFASFNTRSAFLIFPFIVTLILYRLNHTSFVLIILSIFISLPLMRLVGFPFLEPLDLMNSSNDFLSYAGFYIIFSTALLYIIKDSRLLLTIENYSCKILARITNN